MIEYLICVRWVYGVFSLRGGFYGASKGVTKGGKMLSESKCIVMGLYPHRVAWRRKAGVYSSKFKSAMTRGYEISTRYK